tara:strand:- start:157 stop:903 length:747 start_codon:yes stop_codon:yes gene_type:complete
MLSIFGINIYWYGFMYLLGFFFIWLYSKVYLKKINSFKSNDQFIDFLFYCILGVLIGGKLGYAFFYNSSQTLSNPLSILFFWNGGMSFHGGLIGVIIAIYYYARKIKVTFLTLSDIACPLVPIGLFTGRVGNFINGELWGKPTDQSWGIIFPHVDNLYRHPTQLYEAILEGILLFLILNLLLRYKNYSGFISGIFLTFYAIFRSLIEFNRVPDSHIGYLFLDWVTMGQLLCLPMLILGLFLINYSKKQ